MIGLEKETLIFLYAVMTGVVLKCIYDILYLFRKLVKHSWILTGIEDILYWISMSAYLFRALYFTTDGSVRWFFLLGIVCGIFLKQLIQKWLKKVLIK